MFRWNSVFVCLIALTVARANGNSTFSKDVKPLLQRYCVNCHGPKKVKAELRIDQLNPDLVKGHDAEHWEEVLNNLNIGDMPPEDEPQPTAEERELITPWVAKQLRHAAEVKRSTGGRNVLRRLTSYEYNNTLRDLLGLDLDYAKNLPPEGAAKEGFVNNSAVLGTSALHMEYFQRIGAETVRRTLVFGEKSESFVLEFSPEEHLPKPEVNDDGDSKKKRKKKKKSKAPIQVTGAQGAEGGVLLMPVGISKSAHAVSHQRTDYEQWSNYQAFFAEQYAYFLGRMNSVEDVAGANLLDQTMTLYGSATSQTHVSRNYPLVFAGGSNLGIQHGQYRKYNENKTPLANLFVTMLDRMGTNATRFKDSHGGLSELVRS